MEQGQRADRKAQETEGDKVKGKLLGRDKAKKKAAKKEAADIKPVKAKKRFIDFKDGIRGSVPLKRRRCGSAGFSDIMRIQVEREQRRPPP
ncbi:MAG: hypothetical protein JW843_11725 [Candidatus Aminicenantes bacterium]|nr:hypothetical protein [Candidatus Aminicenantes bacterium]